jgi:hypothetical protein
LIGREVTDGIARSLIRYTAPDGDQIDAFPGFCDHFDFDDLLRCIAPRKLFVVSATDDPMSADAEDLVRAALPTFEELNCAGHLPHLRTAGGHALNQDRFEAIVHWVVAEANCLS